MPRILKATETIDLEEAQDRLEISANWAKLVLARLEPYLPAGKLRILEVGAAQGRALVGLSRLGHEAYGIEPYAPAIKVADMLAAAENVRVDIREGRAEKIPFDARSFDLVLAFAVMEHVQDLEQSLREISRVLKPGGIFWFSSASSMCPRQFEIKGFPLFGWYPDRLKKKIMRWAVEHKPELVGHTENPALHWWTPQNAKRRLHEAGFDQIWDRWDIHLSQEASGWRRIATQYAKRHRIARRLGDLVVPGCSYAARKCMD